MGTGTDTPIMAIPALGSSSGHLLFFYPPLLRRFDTTITDPIPLMITMNMTAMTEFGFRGIGNTGAAPMVGKKSGFPAIGNGGRTNKKISKKESRPMISGGFSLISTFLHRELLNAPSPAFPLKSPSCYGVFWHVQHLYERLLPLF